MTVWTRKATAARMHDLSHLLKVSKFHPIISIVKIKTGTDVFIHKASSIPSIGIDSQPLKKEYQLLLVANWWYGKHIKC